MRMKAPDLQGQHLLELLDRYGTQAALSVSPEVGGRIAPSTLQKRIAHARGAAGIKRSQVAQPYIMDKICEHCGAEMLSVPRHQRYCCRSCSAAVQVARRRALEAERRAAMDDPPYGAGVSGCGASCPYWWECGYIERVVNRAAHLNNTGPLMTVLCGVRVSEVKAVADAIDAQPGYRAWLATQDHQLELIEEAA